MITKKLSRNYATPTIVMMPAELSEQMKNQPKNREMLWVLHLKDNIFES